MVYATGQSFFSLKTDALGFGAPHTDFVGLDNYHRALESHSFWAALGRILLFGVVQVPVMLGLALILALLMDAAAGRWIGVFRVIYFLPYAIPGVIAAVLWSYLYSPSISRWWTPGTAWASGSTSWAPTSCSGRWPTSRPGCSPATTC